MPDQPEPVTQPELDDALPSETEVAGEPGFGDLGLRPELVRSLEALGYEEPTPIQREAIPLLLAGRDLVGQAATGTGKTAAFALPALQRVFADGATNEGPRGRRSPRVLVLVPTRELAIQVSEAVHRYGKPLQARVVPIYGGQPIGRQLRALDEGADVVVATPGRALDHLERGTLRLDQLQVVVLDEADEMLDMGFAEDIEGILSTTPTERQTVLFSATLPPRIDAIASRHLRNPVRVRLAEAERASGNAPLVRQRAYLVTRQYKPAALGRLLDVEAPTAALVFCRTREEVDSLTETLNGRGFRAEGLHGGMGQEQRDRVMQRLRSGTAELIVATDVAARGIDVDVLTHVVNYDVPSSPEVYLHRCGRVGRAGREGVALTLAEPREYRMIKMIERVTGRKVPLERIPTVADVRARRLDSTRAALREHLRDGDLDSFRVVVESLADEFDVMEVALAAVKLVHDGLGGADDEEEIPEPSPPSERKLPGRPGGVRDSAFDRFKGPAGGDRSGGGRRPLSAEMVRLYIGAGRDAGIRPGDLVGAIAGESGLSGRDIGAIDITRNFSLVEVPRDAADGIIAALRRAMIKGQRPNVRYEREGAGQPSRGGDRAGPRRRERW